jgi:transcriptional regulator with XRE-family HTH domain
MPEDRPPAKSASEIVAELMADVKFERKTQAQVAAELGLSRSHVSRMKYKGIGTTVPLSEQAHAGRAKTQMRQYGRKKKTDPLGCFLELIYEAYGNVEFLRERVNELQSMFVAGRTERQEVAAYVRLYNDERDRLQKYLKDAARIGLEQRAVKLQEMQAQLIVGVVNSIVDGLELPNEKRSQALKLAADAMRSMTPSVGSSPLQPDSGESAA